MAEFYTCEACGAPLMTGRIISPEGGLFYYPQGSEGPFFPKKSPVQADCYTQCGRLQNFRVERLDKLMR